MGNSASEEGGEKGESMLGGGEGKLCPNVLEVMKTMGTSRTGVERTFIESLAREEEWSLLALL